MKKLELCKRTYKELLAQFSIHLDTLNYSKSTVYNIPNTAKEHLFYLTQNNLELQDVTTKHIAIYFEYLQQRTNDRLSGGLSLGTLHKHAQSIRLFYEYLLLRKVVKSIPSLPKIDQPKSQAKALTLEQIELLFKSCDATLLGKRNTAMLALYYGCGLRRKEGVMLNVEDVDLERSELFIRQSKTRRQRHVPMNEKTQKLIEDYLFNARELMLPENKTETGFLISERGKRLSASAVDYSLKRIAKSTKDQALVKQLTGLHMLRHSIATHLLNAGLKLENIALFLGHTSLDSTQIYTHLSEIVFSKENASSNSSS
jgi:integrase/recombinase XerD